MAPFVGPTRDALVRLLQGRAPRLPITLGLWRPQAAVDRVDGRWRLFELASDEEAARRAGEEAMARGGPWMPEMECIAKLRAMTWTFSE